MRIVLSRKFPAEPIIQLAPYYDKVVEVEKGRPLSSLELRALLNTADTAVVTVTDRIDSKAIASANRLKAIFSFSVGLDHIDVALLKRRGIRLTYTPNVLTDATADLTLTLILACARRLPAAMRLTGDRKFVGFGPNDFLGVELQGATVGLVGLGRIGRAVARRLEAFGAEVFYTGPKQRCRYRHISKEKLLKESDIVSIHCPLNASTHHYIGAKELRIMNPRAILINAARGPIVDERALAAHLKKMPTFYAGLDVYEFEPHIERALTQMPNALCLPHIGSATLSARSRMSAICISEAIRFARGERLQYEYASMSVNDE